jgi:hypothetical protein
MPNPKFRGIAELSTSVVLTILLAAASAVMLGLGGMWAYNEVQKADHLRMQALMQGQAVLDGDVFAAQFNQPVVVEQIGYGWYDGRTGQEVGVKFRDVGASGQYFSWRLDRADYNLTYVIVKDLNSGVRKIFRWRFIKLSPETQAAMAAQFSDVFAKQYAGQYAQQYAQQYAAQYAQQIQQQLQNYINQVIQQQLGPGVNINNPGSEPSGATNTEYVASLYISDPYGVVWMVSSGVQTLVGQGSGRVDIKLKGSTDLVSISSYKDPNGVTCVADPPEIGAQAGGSYTVRFICRPAPTWGYPPPEYPTSTTTTQPPPPPTTPITLPPTPTTVQPPTTPPPTQPPPTTTTGRCTVTVYCVVRPDGSEICTQNIGPPDCEVTTVYRTATVAQPTTTTTPIQFTTSGIKQPVPTTPDTGSGSGGGSGGGSPPVDFCVDCTGAANKGSGHTIQRGDEAYGNPSNFNNVPSSVSAASDSSTTTVTKTYDNGDVQTTTYGSSGSSDTSSSASGSGSGGTNQITGVAGNCVDNMCPT